MATLLRWPGRSCRGHAYLLAGADAARLGEIEHEESAGYERISIAFSALGRDSVGGGRPAPPGATLAAAHVWVATTSNPYFLGLAAPEDMAEQISRASGQSGSNRDYILELATALRDLGEDPGDEVFELERHLRQS